MASGSGGERERKRSHELEKESNKERVSPERALEKEEESEQISAKERVTPERTLEKEIAVLKKESEKENISAGKSFGKERVTLEITPEKEIVDVLEKESEEEHILAGKSSEKVQRVPPERRLGKEIVLQEKEPNNKQISPWKPSDKDQRVPPERTPEKEGVLQEKEQISPGKSSEKERVPPEEGLDKEREKKPTSSDSAWTSEAKKLKLLPEVKYLPKELGLQRVDFNSLFQILDPEHDSYPDITETSEKPLDSPAKVSVLEKTSQSTENLSIGSGLMLLKESHSVGANMEIYDKIHVEEGSKKTDEPENPDLVFLTEVDEEKAVHTHPPNIETKNIGILDQNTSPVGILETMDPEQMWMRFLEKQKKINAGIKRLHQVKELIAKEHDRNIPDSPRPLKTPPTTTGDEHFLTAPLPPPPHSQESASGTGSSTNAAITDDNEKYAAWYQYAIFNVLTPLRDNSNGTNCHDIAKCIREKYKEVPANFNTEVIFHNALELCTKHILIHAPYGSFNLKNPDISFTTWSNQHDELQNNMKEEARKMRF